MAKVLVTGGSGRIGRYVVAELAQGWEVTVLDRQAPEAAGIAHQVGDVLDLDTVRRAVTGQEAVVHLAAIDFGVPARPEEYFGVNVMGTWNVLQAAEEAGIHRVVVTSSISANGLSEVRPDAPPVYLPVDERHPLVPASAYGLSKEAVEVVARGFARHHLTVPCLRPVAVVFPWTVERFVARSQDPEAAWLGAYVSVEDTARAFRLALEADGLRGFQTFYLAAPDSWSEEPTLDRVRRLWGDLPELRDAERYARDPGASMIDCRAAREGLGWEARWRWPELQARRRG